MQHTHILKNLISEITGYGLPFCSCNKQERANYIPAFLFKSANSIQDCYNQVANSSQAFLTATSGTLVFHCSVWIDSLLTHWVNTSESAGMILWITEIKWSAGKNHLIRFSDNRGSRRGRFAQSEAKRRQTKERKESNRMRKLKTLK